MYSIFAFWIVPSATDKEGHPFQSCQENIDGDEETRNQRLNKLNQFLTDQHYPINLINDRIRKAKEIDRQDLINPNLRNNKETKILPLATTHNPRNPSIAPVVSHLNGVFKTDQDMACVLSKFKVIHSKR